MTVTVTPKMAVVVGVLVVFAAIAAAAIAFSGGSSPAPMDTAPGPAVSSGPSDGSVAALIESKDPGIAYDSAAYTFSCVAANGNGQPFDCSKSYTPPSTGGGSTEPGGASYPSVVEMTYVVTCDSQSCQWQATG